jgi:hypothetical protein
MTSMGLFTKNSYWQAKLSIPHTTVTFYEEDFIPNFGDKRTGCSIMTTHRLKFIFHQGIFDQKQHDCRPKQPYFSVCPIEDQTESLPF